VNVRHVYTIQKHKLTKILEPFALFMLFLNNERELTQHLVAGASQHVVEEVCVVGAAIGPSEQCYQWFDHLVMMAHSGLGSWLLGGID
jgi:hypothetical protein